VENHNVMSVACMLFSVITIFSSGKS